MKKILLFPALAMLVAGCDLFTDPRKELTEIGYQFMPEEFIRAAENNDLRAVQLFIRAEQPVDAQGGAALRLAAEQGHTEIVNALIAGGADVNASGGAALTYAAQQGHTEIVAALIDADAEVNVIRDEQAALSFAAENGNNEIVQALLGAGAEIDAQAYFLAKNDIKTLFDEAGYVLQCPEVVEIPAGRFLMGSDEYDSEQPVREVVISKPFALGKYEVTFAEYDAFAKATGRELLVDRGWGRGNRPVIGVTWEDAQAYTEWLTEMTGRPYRLPSEAEWEYAARAGSVTSYSWGDDIGQNQANCDTGCEDSHTYIAPVGSFQPNAFGLYDMHGNVWEWVQDCWNDNYEGAPADARAWEDQGCETRVLRGGSWHFEPAFLRSANRGWFNPSGRFDGHGFRVAQDL